MGCIGWLLPSAHPETYLVETDDDCDGGRTAAGTAARSSDGMQAGVGHGAAPSLGRNGTPANIATTRPAGEEAADRSPSNIAREYAAVAKGEWLVAPCVPSSWPSAAVLPHFGADIETQVQTLKHKISQISRIYSLNLSICASCSGWG